MAGRGPGLKRRPTPRSVGRKLPESGSMRPEIVGYPMVTYCVIVSRRPDGSVTVRTTS